jgi:PAS domain S-box-containing protein
MNNLNKLGYNVMSNLIEYLKVNQGALFVLNDDNDDDPFFFLVTAIAYGRDKFLKKEIRVGEGLVGRCIFEKKTIYLTDVPDDYIKITSGLGTANPNCVLIVPCTLNDQVYGIIELAAFTPLKPYEIEFVEKLGESIASTISSVRISEKTTKLLRASQVQSEELAAQEEELRQNLEEMETTQEDLKRQMAENAEIRENLAKETALLDCLMENSLDLIYFKDRESRFIRVTKSMLKIFNMTSYDQLYGKTDFDFAVKEEAQHYYDDEQKIIRTGIPIINQLQRETRHDGSIQYTVTSKYPLMDSNGNIIGTFGLTKDVTSTKVVEEEAKKQAEELRIKNEQNLKIQEKLAKETALLDSLMNTLHDLIYFKDRESRFTRVTKSMLNFLNVKSFSELEGKSDFDFAVKEEAQKYYDDEQRIMKTGVPIIDQIQKETRRDGSIEYTTTSKYPLVDSNGEVIGTFGFTKDITEYKKLEDKAVETEKKIETILGALNLSSILMTFNNLGEIIDVNDHFLKLTGLKRNQVIGKTFTDGIVAGNTKIAEQKKKWSKLMKGESIKELNQFILNKKEYWFDETFTPVKNQNDEVEQVIKVGFDVTAYYKK